MIRKENECCANCRHLATLWDWKNYPKEKFNRHCCTLFVHDKDEQIVMVLFGSLQYGMCECFEEKQR